ncbi:MAG: hypothetical protein FWE03_00760 [Firmicutes bacterium]|nr:hypothetical protein [Bacillota bacterium]
MSRESKIIDCPPAQQKHCIYEVECFGWELLNLHGERITVCRETQHPKYQDILKLESALNAKKQLQNELIQQKIKLSHDLKLIQKKSDCMIMALAIIFSLGLAIIYFVKANNKRKLLIRRITNRINELNLEIEKLQPEMSQICQDARATFFGKH